jgi:ATP-dependent helicase HrpA
VDAIVAERQDGVVRDPEAFEEVLSAVRTHVATRVLNVVDEVEPVLGLARQVEQGIARLGGPTVAPMAADLKAQLASLVYPGFVADTGMDRLAHLRRYLRAMLQRIDKAPAALARDAQSQEVVDRVEEAYADLLDSLAPVDRRSQPVLDVGWMIEELRVSLFANGLGTAYPVSEKRIRKAMASLSA